MYKTIFDKIFFGTIIVALLFFLQISFAGELRSVSLIFTADTHATFAATDDKPDLWDWAATLLNLKQQEPQLIMIDCGDTFQGSLIAAETRGEMVAKVFKQLPFDLIIPGNHDFDFGLEQLHKLLRQSYLTALSANTPQLTDQIQSWKMLEQNQLKIAVIGISGRPDTQPLAQISETDALELILPEILRARPDIIILARHGGKYGKPNSVYDLSQNFPELDLIAGAHSHQGAPGEKISARTWYLQAPPHCRGIIRCDLQYDTGLQRIVKLRSREIIPNKHTTLSPPLALLRQEVEKMQKANQIIINQLTKPWKFPQSKNDFNSPISRLAVKSIQNNAEYLERQTPLLPAVILHNLPVNRQYSSQLQLNNELIFEWFPFEERVGEIELSAAELMTIVQEIFQAPAAYPNAFAFDGLKIIRQGRKLDFQPERTAEFYRLIASEFVLNGANGRYPGLRRLISTKKVFFYQNTLRKMVSTYILYNKDIVNNITQ
ncbi:MAG: metallophosphoesterase [Victivallaceae bacterium]